MIDLVSIHIPKTAGRSFLAVLKSVYDTASVAHFDRKNYPLGDRSPLEQFKSELTNDHRIVHGHFHYSEIKDKIVSSTRVITWLRNPVERVISNYGFFKLRVSQLPDDEELKRRKNETLIEYASLENSRNRMQKFTAGLDIEKFFFVGITETFAYDVRILGEMMNWPPVPVSRINDNAIFKSGLPPVTNKERALIEELNREDVELYTRVLKIRNKKIS
jgi:hypothetical protein